jgi:hypothetical protein
LSKTYIGEIIASVGGKTAYPHFETWPLVLNLYRNIFKMVKDLNVRPEFLKLLEEIIKETRQDISPTNDFL